MTNHDAKEFAKLMAGLSQAFDKPMSDLLVQIYFDALKDFALEQVALAVSQAVASKKFMPKVAELRELIEGAATDKSELAWRTFVELVKFEGAYPSLQVYDKGMAYAIECLGGWQTACEKIGAASPEMVASYEKSFKNSYRLGEMRPAESGYFSGAVEANNRTLGQWKTPTIEQPVCLVRLGKVEKVTMPLDVAQGRLTDEARQALADGGEALKKYLPAPTKPVKALNPAPGAEMATSDEVAELRRSIMRLVPGSSR